MPGRAAITGISAVKSDIKSIQMGDVPSGAGDLEGEYSPIGGAGRKGSDAYGTLSDPGWTRIDAEVTPQGDATKGEQGVGYGVGRTFGGGGGTRAQD